MELHGGGCSECGCTSPSLRRVRRRGGSVGDSFALEGSKLTKFQSPVGGAPKSPGVAGELLIAAALIKVDIDVKINHKGRLEFKSQEVILMFVFVPLTWTQSGFPFPFFLLFFA